MRVINSHFCIVNSLGWGNMDYGLSRMSYGCGDGWEDGDGMGGSDEHVEEAKMLYEISEG